MTSPEIRTVALPSGEAVPVLGLGTWAMGKDRRKRAQEVEALQTGLDLGMTLIDTAEMYGDGASERLIGRSDRRTPRRRVPRQQGAAAPRDPPRHDRRVRVQPEAAAHRATRPLPAALAGQRAARGDGERIRRLVRDGRIRHWGVSNFDIADMKELIELACGRRGRDQPGALQPAAPRHRVEPAALLPTADSDHGLLADRCRAGSSGTRSGASSAGAQATSAQVALAWVISHPGVCAIPKSRTPRARAGEPRSARRRARAGRHLLELDAAFPPPPRPVPLEML